MSSRVRNDAMRIGLLTSSASRLGGGVFEAVSTHAAMLRAEGYDPVVIALEDEHSAADRNRFDGCEVIHCPVMGPGIVGYSPSLVRRMVAADLDVVHLHGIWMYPSRAVGGWASRTGRPYIISPHGMLDPWIVGRGRAKKSIARLAYERKSWQGARLFHALTEKEASDIAAQTGRTDILVIPNAVPASHHAESPEDAPFALYIGRIHPKKNLGALLEGWRRAVPVLGPAGARLVIAGWGEEEHVADLQRRLSERSGDEVSFIGAVYGERKQALLSTARFLVLPSHSEGLPVAILEAWASGTPTLMSAHCNLPQGFVHGAAIDCGVEPETIATTLTRGFTLKQDGWAAMSAAASALAVRDFSPAGIARSWREIYDRVGRATSARPVAA